MESIYLKNLENLKNDDVFPTVEIVNFADAIGKPTRKGYDNLIISNGEIVNVCSSKYGLLKNENFFLKVEEKLIDADVHYITRSINRENRSFAVDYILQDDRYEIAINGNKKDSILPKLRFLNSYDGSGKTQGTFGFYRQVCSNGLHIAETKLKFDVKHRGNICELVLPEIDNLIEKFMNNEYYSLKQKAEFLSSNKLTDVQTFVKKICNETNVFKFEKSDKNPEPSKYADMVINTIFSEANQIGVEPNMWLGYNAFNQILYSDTFKKSFDKELDFDAEIFDSVMLMVN